MRSPKQRPVGPAFKGPSHCCFMRIPNRKAEPRVSPALQSSSSCLLPLPSGSMFPSAGPAVGQSVRTLWPSVPLFFKPGEPQQLGRRVAPGCLTPFLFLDILCCAFKHPSNCLDGDHFFSIKTLPPVCEGTRHT